MERVYRIYCIGCNRPMHPGLCPVLVSSFINHLLSTIRTFFMHLSIFGLILSIHHGFDFEYKRYGREKFPSLLFPIYHDDPGERLHRVAHTGPNL